MVDLDEIKDTFDFFDDWEDKYRFIVDIGKSVPPLPSSKRTDKNIVRGCQSQVWLVSNYDITSERLQFEIYSDAQIVRGLIAIIQAAYENMTPRQILEYDIEGLFEDLQLFSHLVASRGNGLRAMVQRIRAEARTHQSAEE